ncbi:MAG: glycosyl hydrolase family 28-related protein [Ferruginibacter sp.]
MLKKIKIITVATAILFSKTISAQQYYNVIKYGAKNDSSKLCTTAIAKAIDAASKTGGGTIYFPAGKYLSPWSVSAPNANLFF